jgi:HPt (histidine-containing phosphotransfer) domain-containing protein
MIEDDANDEEMVVLVASFVSSMGRRSEAMSAAASGGDRAGLERLAHQLKGAAGSYGFPGISEAAGALEETAADGGRTTTQVEAALATLLRLIQAARLAHANPADKSGGGSSALT